VSVPFVLRREVFAGSDFYPILENERTDVIAFARQAPDTPRQSEAAGVTRRARMQAAFFLHYARWTEERFGFAFDKYGQVRPQADTPYGFEQQNIGDRINIARRPVKSYGSRHIMRT
jgi:hypothetical protein